jgi:DNA invertase Pin-like site-specific DNA recombinase
LPLNAILKEDSESENWRKAVSPEPLHIRSFVKDTAPANNARLLGYERVSKGNDENNVLKAEILRAAGCRRLFEEAASGGRWDRLELHSMLDHRHEGDTVVCELDRLSRSLKEVLHITERIAKVGADFRSIT